MIDLSPDECGVLSFVAQCEAEGQANQIDKALLSTCSVRTVRIAEIIVGRRSVPEGYRRIAMRFKAAAESNLKRLKELEGR